MGSKRYVAIGTWRLIVLTTLIAPSIAIQSGTVHGRAQSRGQGYSHRDLASLNGPVDSENDDAIDVSAVVRSSRVVYADMVCNSPKNQALLNTQLETWAEGAFSEERFYAVTGEGTTSIKTEFQTALIQTDCEDSYYGIACKEYFLEKEAFNRQADWLVILGEDNYIDTSTLEQKLSEIDGRPGQLGPTAVGIVGCKLLSCPELPDAVSICGGGGLFLNRAAINLLFADGGAALYAEYSAKRGQPNDAITSCALQKRGGKLMDSNSGLIANRMQDADALEAAISIPSTAVLHYLTTPEVMRWTHAVRRKHWTEEVALKKEAFVEDCCCWYEDEIFETEDCDTSISLEISLLGSANESFFDRLARLHVEDRVRSGRAARTH